MFLIEIDGLVLIEHDKPKPFKIEEVANKLLAIKTIHPTFNVNFREITPEDDNLVTSYGYNTVWNSTRRKVLRRNSSSEEVSELGN